MAKTSKKQGMTWFIGGLLLLFVLFIAQSRLSRSKLSEGFQEFASAFGWPFDRVLQPLNYLLADAYPWSNYYPVTYDYWTGLPYQVVLPGGPWSPGGIPGPWYQMTRY